MYYYIYLFHQIIIPQSWWKGSNQDLKIPVFWPSFHPSVKIIVKIFSFGMHAFPSYYERNDDPLWWLCIMCLGCWQLKIEMMQRLERHIFKQFFPPRIDWFCGNTPCYFDSFTLKYATCLPHLETFSKNISVLGLDLSSWSRFLVFSHWHLLLPNMSL